MTVIYKPFGDHTRIEIFSDDNDKPQVDMNLNAFFGVLLPAGPLSDVLSNRSDNRIAGSNRGLLPNRLATIPNQAGTELTLYRLHALHRKETPAVASFGGTFQIAVIGGRGFVAGLFKAIRQRDMNDLLYHMIHLTLIKWCHNIYFHL